jgi:hypothetical protein
VRRAEEPFELRLPLHVLDALISHD